MKRSDGTREPSLADVPVSGPMGATRVREGRTASSRKPPSSPAPLLLLLPPDGGPPAMVVSCETNLDEKRLSHLDCRTAMFAFESKTRLQISFGACPESRPTA